MLESKPVAVGGYVFRCLNWAVGRTELIQRDGDFAAFVAP
jgi:hypothetical protein